MVLHTDSHMIEWFFLFVALNLPAIQMYMYGMQAAINCGKLLLLGSAHRRDFYHVYLMYTSTMCTITEQHTASCDHFISNLCKKGPKLCSESKKFMTLFIIAHRMVGLSMLNRDAFHHS